MCLMTPGTSVFNTDSISSGLKAFLSVSAPGESLRLKSITSIGGKMNICIGFALESSFFHCPLSAIETVMHLFFRIL